jgi:uncharacterized repeat protein (TIGR01451 family)
VFANRADVLLIANVLPGGPTMLKFILTPIFVLGIPGLAFAAPANDTCAGAVPLTLNRITKGTTVGANNDYQTVATTACYAGIGQTPTTAPGRDIVFKFTPPAIGNYSFRIVQQYPGDPIFLQDAVLYVADPDAGDGGCPAATGVVGCLKGANRERHRSLASSTGLNNNQSEETECIPLDSAKTYYIYFDDGAAGNAGSAMSLEPIECQTEVEPNGTTATATPFVCGILGRSDVAPSAHCHLGTRDGLMCTRTTPLDRTFPDSVRTCSLSPNATCVTDLDCANLGQGVCVQRTDLDCDPRCIGGPNNGLTCSSTTPSITNPNTFCNPIGNEGAICAGTCVPDSVCVLGPTPGAACTATCSGGTRAGQFCSFVSGTTGNLVTGCPGGTCLPNGSCGSGTCSRQFNEGDEDFFSLGAPPAGSKIFAGLEAKSANDNDWRMRITTTTSTLQFDDDDGTPRNGANAPEIAGAVVDGTDTFVKVSRTAARTAEPYELYAIVRPPLAAAQLEDESGPRGNDYYYGWPGDVINANYATAGGYVKGAFQFPGDSDCFKFLVNKGDLMDWFGDGNPGRINGGTGIAGLPHPFISDAEPAGISYFYFTANPRRNTLPNVASAGLSGLTPSVTSSYFQWRASYTGMLEVCYYDASGFVTGGPPSYPNAWAGSLSVNCGPLQPAGPGTTTTDVSITQSGPLGPFNTGTFATYTITVTNDGAEIAQEARLTDTLPPTLTFISLVVDDGFGGNNTACFSLEPGLAGAALECNNTSMAPGTTTTYTLTVQVNNCIGAGVNVANTASISTVSTDPNAGNDQTTVSFTTSEDGSCVDIVCDAERCVPDSCTTNDHCVAGVCVTEPANCDDNSVCTEDSCSSDVGCINDPTPADGCDDWNPCTLNFCDPIVFCVFPPAPAGTACDDYASCTTSDACDGQGTCVGTSTCDDGDVCTDGSCGELGCVYSPISCDDGNACTVDSCTAFVGCRHVALNCDDNNVCTTDSCNPATGCVHTNNTNACDDGNVCTTIDSCDGGTCVGASPLSCTDGNACTADTCNPAVGCYFPPVNCDDGNACTTDACALAGGCHHSPISCFDDDSCTIDTCAPASGCQHAPINCGEDTSDEVGGGETVTTDPEGDGATPSDPVESTITSPNGGTVTIEESQASTPPPVGLSFLDLQIHVTAPPATAADPVRLVFRVDASVLPAGFDANALIVFKNGVAVAECTGAPGVASPDPCTASRVILPDGDLEVTVLTSTLSTFNFGFPECQPPSEATGVNIGADKDTLTWTAIGGAGISYDAVRGMVAQLPVGSGPLEACLAIEVAGASAADPIRPAPGAAFWYLVRGRSACGVGGYGTRSNGAPRVATECP